MENKYCVHIVEKHPAYWKTIYTCDGGSYSKTARFTDEYQPKTHCYLCGKPVSVKYRKH